MSTLVFFQIFHERLFFRQDEVDGCALAPKSASTTDAVDLVFIVGR